MTASDNKSTAPSWLAGAGAVLSLAACYGTLGLVTLLSTMGVALSVNVHVWAAVIVGFALLAVLGVALGYQRHGKAAPLLLALAGAALVAWAMYGPPTIGALLRVPAIAVELAGFSLLVVAAFQDWRAKR